VAIERATAGEPRKDRRHARHEATRQEILQAAWDQMWVEGVAALSLRGLARSVGMEPQSLYSYFDSKHAIYDALFAEANTELLGRLRASGQDDDGPAEALQAIRRRARIMVEFCMEDPVRYQLLFQRTIPGFEPSEPSYAIAREIIDQARRTMARAGLGSPRHLEIYTSLVSGLVAQQLANDPGGRRYVRHLDETLDMYFEHMTTARRKT
jgi:AcrR family transcriptional regulator